MTDKKMCLFGQLWVLDSRFSVFGTTKLVWIVSVFLFQSILILSPAVVIAAKAPIPQRILFMKFSYFGPVDASGLANEVTEGISRRLSAAGNSVISSQTKTSVQMAEIISQARAKDARFAVWGSVSLLGDRISIDVRVLDIKEPNAGPTFLYAEGRQNEMSHILDQVDMRIKEVFATPVKVGQISISGNRRVDTDAIRDSITTKVGETFDPQMLSSDIKAVYKMGYFDDVQVDVKDGPKGKIVTFILKEKPAIREIKIKGNKTIKNDKIKETIALKPYTVINEKALQDAAQKIRALYEDKGYLGTEVEVSVEDVSGDAADVIFDVREGEKAQIKSIEFQGNKAFSDKELKDLMETSEKKPFWIPSIKNIMAFIKGEAAVLKFDALDRDVGRITAFYHNHGYVDATVGQPVVKRQGANLYVTIPVQEGEKYGVGDIKIEEDYFHDTDKLLADMQIKEKPVFSQEVLRQDILKLTDKYADQGFAYADITPKITKDPEKKVVNITLIVNKGPKVRWGLIDITGNIRTRDKVIRRELKVTELDTFSATALKKSKDRLNRLGYFEEVSLTPNKGSTEDTMDLDVKVKERPTGTFSIGAGYSSVDKLMFMGEISQRNFLGKGQTLSFKGIVGSVTNRFSFSFVEPYLFDTKWSLGTDIYNWRVDYADYTKDSTGGTIRVGYPLTDELRVFVGLRADNTTLSNVADTASQIIRDSINIKTTRSISLGIGYDNRNDFYLPTRGWNNSISLEYAGGLFGGDSAFVKTEGTISYYHPIWMQLVGHVRGGMGYVTQGSGGRLPVYEKFFLGGIDSIRGYKYEYVSPIDPKTGERIGGTYMGFAQFETIFPLIKDMGLNWVMFFDVGNVWDSNNAYDLSDLKKSIGFGLRWLSPIGPLRIEWGYNLDKQPGDRSSNLEFTMGGTF
ncbi:MAG: outer membrane protein assembly factor BamA [Dissulfurimicrobium sp.]|uniref:outer membrane protein assembly factor BamA n=1 Tax=Dissulfurimicrobium sp. TaxID=2022436 RepID=UPI00404AA7B8